VTTDTPEDYPDPDPSERPSKSQRKRAAHAAQDLGDAIREARRITSRAAGARQRQYIGKLMREIDLDPIRAALAARSERDALETQLFKRAEGWRERLISEGDAALDELARLRPGIERAEWGRRIAAARTERSSGTGGPAGRELFRALRTLLG
jgi:ribosome-associated protein